MDHSITLQAYNTRLRPVRPADAEFILGLRTMPHVLGTVGNTMPDVASQRKWIDTYLNRKGDYYFIVESAGGESWGTISIYDVKAACGEWGRWIILPGVAAALPSAILIHQVAFEIIRLHELKGCVVSTNRRVISFHRRFGLRETGAQKAARQIAGRWVDLIWFVMEKERWPAVQQRLVPLAQAAALSLASDAPHVDINKA